MCLRAPGGSKGPPVTHEGLRVWGAPGPHGGAPYVTPILRAGLELLLAAQAYEIELAEIENRPDFARLKTGRVRNLTNKLV
jgi:hypothetical protein